MLDPSDPEAHAVFGMSLGHKGDFARAKAAFDTALRLAPNAAEILTFYAGWASTFGEPERGADIVDQIIRLDPQFPMWQAKPFTYAYFMAGRYEDALRMIDRLGLDNYNLMLWSMRAGALAALGRSEEARTWVAEALKQRPEISIELMANEPGYSEAERHRFVDTMRLAGFPPCATAGQLAHVEKPLRLPECAGE
jgi:tetratricopeptide (TPR) repeat protein